MSVEDFAQIVELQEWERNNLKPHAAQTRFEPGEFDYGPEECVECGEKMPDERRAWGFTLCVTCKAETEQPYRR